MDEELELTALVDVDILQRMQDAFSAMTGIAAITTDIHGVPVTKGSDFSEFCMDCIRNTEEGRMRCEMCDKTGARLALEKGEAVTYVCHAGLVDFAAPIMAKDKMVGCFIGGQVLIEPLNVEEVQRIAVELGGDSEKYVMAVNKVNVMSKEQIQKAAGFLYTIATILSDIAYSRYIVNKANMKIKKAANMKSDFLANMSHEIRTPMNAVIGMAEMALREDLSENGRKYVNEIKVAGKSLLTIINDILDFSKIESGKMNIIPIEYEPMSVINDITNIVMTRLEDKDVEFILDVDPNMPNRLLGDNDRVKQIILNIVNNAIKFTKKGYVSLHFSFERQSDEDITLQFSVEDTGIGIKKEDLSKLFQSFQQLDSKRNRNVEGTGLGLAICKQLLTLMGGDISVESVYGEGSKFSFSIPQKIVDEHASISIKNDTHIVATGLFSKGLLEKHLIASVEKLGAEYVQLHNVSEIALIKECGVTYIFVESSLMSEKMCEFLKANPQITAVIIADTKEKIDYDIPNLRIIKKPVYALNLAQAFNNESSNYDYKEQNAEIFDFVAPEAKILLVDDNAVNLTVAEGLLEPLEMQIDTVTSGKDAIEKISENKYDIIFMDHMMPDLDGVETTHIIRRFHPEYEAIPIIALTANAANNIMDMFLKEGMNDFVAKPIEVRVLVSKVKHWLPIEKIYKKSVDTNSVSKQEVHKLPEIGDLDVKFAIQLLGGEKLFWRVLRDYYRVIEQKAAIIKSLEEEEKWSSYTIEVHALKSASKQIGAHSLSEKAANLEKAGNDEDSQFIHENTDEMLLQYYSYISILEPFFVENKKDSIERKPISSDILEQLFSKMRVAMENLDMDEMEAIVEEMKQYHYKESQETLFKQLQEAVENIDVDACEEILHCWEKN